MEDLPMEYDKNSYITKLYDGQIIPHEKLFINTKEYRENERKIKTIEKELKEILTEDDYKKIELLSEYCNFKCACNVSRSFEEGFKHGVKLMTSVFSEGEKN